MRKIQKEKKKKKRVGAFQAFNYRIQGRKIACTSRID
jgi:hypothetical protein